MNAEIISVGTELLLGDILNTNAQFLSKELAKLGINVFYETVVGDNQERLELALKAAFERSNLVITTGGLGPTADDLTKETGAKYFNKPLIMHEASLTKITEFFASIKTSMTDNNIKQALIPENALPLCNNNGTAPGCLIEENGKILIMLPGPPVECTRMFTESVTPYLSKRTNEMLVSKTLLFTGIGESTLEDAMKDLLDAQSNPTIALYAKDSGVTIRITAKAKDEDEAEKLIIPVSEEIYRRFGQYIYGENEMSLAEAVVSALKEKKLTISCAESCTGGLLTAALVDVPGVSQVLLESVVTYSNQSKIKRLSVSEKTLTDFGAVSPQTAIEMAENVAKSQNTDIGVSTTGIAGPDGGTADKPVGLVYIGLYVCGKSMTKELRLHGTRKKIRERSVVNVLHFLLQSI